MCIMQGRIGNGGNVLLEQCIERIHPCGVVDVGLKKGLEGVNFPCLRQHH